jgi:transcriptional regulator with XRE-family HTH domain
MGHQDNGNNSGSDGLENHKNLGWRLRTLRIRHGLTLVELAKESGLDVSYLSRLERDALQNARPKADTVYKVLTALDASAEERDAVFHVERPPLMVEEINDLIRQIGSKHEAGAEPTLLLDEHWYYWYMNRSARAALGYTEEEYRRSLGAHLLHGIFDPTLPRYSRVPEDARAEYFSLAAMLFKLNFAGQEFDQWYTDVVDHVYDFAWAAELWEHPLPVANSGLIERQSVTIQNEDVGVLEFQEQLSRLIIDPRFSLGIWTPSDKKTAGHVERLRADERFTYPVALLGPEDGFLPPGESDFLGDSGIA